MTNPNWVFWSGTECVALVRYRDRPQAWTNLFPPGNRLLTPFMRMLYQIPQVIPNDMKYFNVRLVTRPPYPKVSFPA